MGNDLRKRKTAASEETTVSHSMVGMTGFEPAASASRTQRSTKLSHIPKCCLRQQTVYYHNGSAWQALFSKEREHVDVSAPCAWWRTYRKMFGVLARCGLSMAAFCGTIMHMTVPSEMTSPASSRAQTFQNSLR